MTSHELTTAIKQQAEALGFGLAGVCPAVSPVGVGRFEEWLSAGYAGQMQYLSERREAYHHPRHVLEGARSIVMLAMSYAPRTRVEPGPGEGRVARYAWGEADYHDLIHERLHALADEVRLLAPEARIRGVVDTAPLLEREFAQLAGLGWAGKNTLLLNKQLGSYFFLAALLTDLTLEYDEPHEADHCGTCTACLDACPTNAFPEPYVLDSSRCISYLTIELRELAPAELRDGIGDWLFGCDVCQEVCPWNQRAPESAEPQLAPRASLNPIDAAALFELDEATFRERFRHSPLWRPKRRGLLRNAAIVLGNRPSAAGRTALTRGLQDEEPLVRAACAWALGKYSGPAARQALSDRARLESNSEVRAEIDNALSR